MKFEKIKTTSDKRLGLKNRGFAAQSDFKPGDILTLSEKMDGYNASFDTSGISYSRSGALPENMQYHKKLIPFKEMANTLYEVLPSILGDDNYQVFGEFMVTDRIVKYDDDVYNKFYIFDIYNQSKRTYLGIKEAEKLALELRKHSDMIMPPNIIAYDYEFTTYEDLEEFVYSLEYSSMYGADGVMEGVVSVNQNGLRAKTVNKNFKETQRTVTNLSAHRMDIRWLNQYLTQPRVTKIVKNLITEGVLNPMSDDYYKGQLAVATETILKDILEESTDTPVNANNRDIRNKIEARARLTMRDELHY